jgi:signal transduction histidine kinase
VARPGTTGVDDQVRFAPDSTDFNESRGAGMIPRPPLSDSCQRRISAIDWISSSIVHDLRNPLGTVSAGAEMLMELDSLPSQAKRLAANIFRAASRMRELLGDLAEANYGNKPTFAICKIREVIIAASEAASAAAEKQNVQILNNVPARLEMPLKRFRIERVFFNLITNALEAMPDGGRIRIGARKAGDCVLIDVEDTGPGIPRGIRERLFEPFVTAGKDHGLGLGLALSRQTVRDHGGDMWTERSTGAHFVIRLPLESDGDVL